MQPFYYTVSTNFGDYMNSWLWPALIPEMLDRKDDIRLVGIGSLLSRNLDLVQGRKVIFGTGSGYSSPPSREQARNWLIYCVRGPLTAGLMGLDPALAVTDGAWLINQIPGYAELPAARSGTVFVPHWTSAQFGNWNPICQAASISYVNPLWDCARVFSNIAHAELAIVESLHGAIIADYYRTPWIPVFSPSRILKFKWLDWCKSLDLEYVPYHLPPSDYLDCLLQRISPRTVDTRLYQINVPINTYDIKQTPAPPAQAGLLYQSKYRVKKQLRSLRDYGMAKLSKARDNALARNWNAHHTDRMSAYFTQLRSQTPCLSMPNIRNEKIDKLNDALEKLRSDFKDGLL
jgi:succinoglycan biosynthesis protein ExoV